VASQVHPGTPRYPPGVSGTRGPREALRDLLEVQDQTPSPGGVPRQTPPGTAGGRREGLM